MPDYDLVVVGAGPGGYVAAIRAGQLGLKAAVVERDELGGICLNWGCIPSKALLRNAEVLRLFNRAEEFGISFDNLTADYGKAIDRSRKVVSTLTSGVAGLLKKNNVQHIKGNARLVDANTLEVTPDGTTLTADNIMIATGATARSIPGVEIDGVQVITSREALALRDIPKSVFIIGGGATGCEFAYLYNAYGSQVTIVEMLPHLLPNEDEEISRQLERAFTRQGIKFMTETRVNELGRNKTGLTVTTEQGGELKSTDTEKVLVAVGVQPNTDNIGLEEVGVQLERGFVKVDGSMATNIPGIYAVGDVTGVMLLAHVAMAQGVLAVERIAGIDTPELRYGQMPKATYCHPQVTSFGLTEKAATEHGYSVKVGKFPFAASGKAQAIGDTEGMVKVVAAKDSGEILGVHMIGPEVTEMLGEMSLVQFLEGTVDEVGWLVHSHPTLSEVLKEAALAADGKAIHI
ncbi:MAG: dihydrolipoyl dehydrogenase [Chloroflexota bacterium]|nr:dihydrolipoyl dehydrogenase [Chloroflexota bacterium]